MTAIKTLIGPQTEAQQSPFAPSSDIPYSDVWSAIQFVKDELDTLSAEVRDDPIVILVSGQSNAALRRAYSWTPPENLQIWNRDDALGESIGTAFGAAPGDEISFGLSVARAEAMVNSLRTVYLVNVGYSGQPISKWLSGGPTPDVYAQLKQNVEAALAAVGLSKIDAFFWWQGESDAANGSTTYAADFAALVTRLRAETWFPYETPVIVHGLSRLTGSQFEDFNRYLAANVAVEPDFRKYVNAAASPSSYWEAAEALPNIHGTAEGYQAFGKMAWEAWRSGGSRASVQGFTVDPETGNILHGAGIPAADERFATRKDQAAPTVHKVRNSQADASAAAVYALQTTGGTWSVTLYPNEFVPLANTLFEGAGGLHHMSRHATGQHVFHVGLADTVKFSVVPEGAGLANDTYLCARNNSDSAWLNILKVLTNDALLIQDPGAGISILGSPTPLVTSSYSLGSTTNRWLKGWFDNVEVGDDAYAAGWNGSLNVPTKNAVYDKIELVLGTTLPATYQPLDSDLTAIAALSTTAFGRSALTMANAAALATLAGVGSLDTPQFDGIQVGHASDTTIRRNSAGRLTVEGQFVLMDLDLGVTVQGYDADLAAIAALTPSNDDIIQRKAGAWTNRTMAQLIADLAALGTTFQPLDSDLTSWAGVARASGFDTFAATPSSANLRALLTDETGTGIAYFVGGALGTPSSATLTNATGLPSIVAANEGTDTTCFPAFFTAATGELGPKTNANLTYNSNTGAFGSTSFVEGGTALASKYQALDTGLTNLAALTGVGLVRSTATDTYDTFDLVVMPQGRLTLTTAVPVLTATVSGATTIYYAPYVGRMVPLYDGTQFVMHDIGGELSQATTDNTKSPAAVANNSNYDLFVWNDSGTYRCTRGPAWSSDTSRGSGAGTTELTRINGVLVNNVAITNGPAANRGTYVGTVRSNGSAAIDWILGALAASGTASRLCVWNMYNRIAVRTMVRDTTDNWTLASASIRSANNSTTMRVSFVTGASEDFFRARYTDFIQTGTSNFVSVGIGYDSTSAFSGVTGTMFGSAAFATLQGSDIEQPLGFHFFQALEASQVSGTATFYGDNGTATYVQNGLEFEGRF